MKVLEFYTDSITCKKINKSYMGNNRIGMGRADEVTFGKIIDLRVTEETILPKENMRFKVTVEIIG